MIKKNVYIIYPAGYHGTYLKWAIEVSDTGNMTVPRNPINYKSTARYGGVGTAHINHRLPTHQAMRLHEMWIIHNRPTDKKIYQINSMQDYQSVPYTASQLLLQDSAGIVINIHDSNSDDWAAYGRINCVTKWPVYMAAVGEPFRCHEEFDPFNCAHDILFRNHLVNNPNLLARCPPPSIQQIQGNLANYDRWYRVRNKFNPHEVNHDTYPETPTTPGRFFPIPMEKIVSSMFPSFLEELLTNTGVLSDIDCSPVHEIHLEYIKVQPNLVWFDSISHWHCNGNLDDYLQSHSVIESEVLRRIFSAWNKNQSLSLRHPISKLPWTTMTLWQINAEYQSIKQK